MKRKEKGFTLIELVVVMVLLDVMAVIAIPKYIDLTQEAKIAATQGELGSLRSTLTIQYADNATAGNAVYPSSLTASDFGNNRLPKNVLSGVVGITTVASVPSGTATNGSSGFWYMVATGEAGAYSDGTEDTSVW